MITYDEIGKLAKGITVFAVRNETSLENFHADQVPITNERMKILMKEIVNNINFILEQMYESEESCDNIEQFLMKYANKYAYNWDDPDKSEFEKYIEKRYQDKRKKGNNE